MTENLRHWRCPECGRLCSDAEPFVDRIWCFHTGQFSHYEPRVSMRGAMERLEEQYYVCHAPPWPDPLFVSDRERADEIVAEFADRGARLLVRVQADWWDDGGPR